MPGNSLRTTANWQFAEPFTRIEADHQVGLIPVSPTTPAPPESCPALRPAAKYLLHSKTIILLCGRSTRSSGACYY